MGRVKWNRSQEGFVESKERRFLIGARCGGSTTPDWYSLQDRVTGRTYYGGTQRECKEIAEGIVVEEEIPKAKHQLQSSADGGI